MTIPFPTPQFPSALLEVGPPEDRTILLRGIAEIAGALFDVIAIRVDPISMAPDFRDTLPRNAYANHRLGDMLEDIAAHTEINDSALLQLSAGRYAMMMVPSAEGSLE